MNVSEGRDPAKLRAIAGAIQSVSGAFLLHWSADTDHHRAVFSFMGGLESIGVAAFAAARQAVSLIDLRTHRGVHPRMGAVDVVPFVPLNRVSLEQCVEIAVRLGEKVAADLGVPVYLYGRAARTPERENLAWIRRGEFESLMREIAEDPARRPDFGEARLHPTAGATAIGARDHLIAFNLYLNTDDQGVARKIAANIREARGGLPGVKALGFYLPRRGRAQVSVNITDYRRTSLLDVYEAVRRQARLWGAEVSGSEIVGLVPRAALPEAALEGLQLENFQANQILEDRLAEVLGLI